MAKSLTVASFDNVGEAEILRQELEDIGVNAWLSDDAITVALWHVGSALGGVKVQIDAADEQVAYKLVAERQRRRSRNVEAKEWYCGRCREWISPSFDLCWSCRGPRDEVERQQPLAASAERLRVAEDEASKERQADHAASDVDRIWRASIVGWAICPPVFLPPIGHFYSAWLAAGLDKQTLDRRSQNKLRGAMVSNLIAFAVFLLLWAYAIFAPPADPLEVQFDDPLNQAPLHQP